MMFRSVRGQSPLVSFETALFEGLAPDGGLYVPETMPRLPEEFLRRLGGLSLIDVGIEILSPFVSDMTRDEVREIVAGAWDFPIRLSELEDGIHLLELFHGPTLAFKDFGARFMARAVSRYVARRTRDITILVATSGDTGSAVASGFYGVPHITVHVLYPSGRISPLQEKQIATLGGNIHAIEVEGAFDDCQRLVKQALGDPEIRAARRVTTANSINVGRLLPQAAYYGWAAGQLPAAVPPTVIVPSGNFGNLVAAVCARRMGIPIERCGAATNANDVVPEYLRSGTFTPRASVATLSNAMDVGNPSNLARLEELYGNDFERLRADIPAWAVTDEETRAEMRGTYERTGVVLDPHTAVGVAAARRARSAGTPGPIIVPATAHPGKFPEVIQAALGTTIPTPPALEAALGRPTQSVRIPADYETFRKLVLST